MIGLMVGMAASIALAATLSISLFGVSPGMIIGVVHTAISLSVLHCGARLRRPRLLPS
jgi:hypothetical protein